MKKIFLITLLLLTIILVLNYYTRSPKIIEYKAYRVCPKIHPVPDLDMNNTKSEIISNVDEFDNSYLDRVNLVKTNSLNNRSLQDYKNKKWGYSNSFNFIFNEKDAVNDSNQIIYEKINEVSSLDYIFKKISSDKMIMYNELSYNNYIKRIKSKYYLPYRIIENDLWVEFNGKFCKLFERKKTLNGLHNFIGKSIFNKHYYFVKFYNQLFFNIYEFYLIETNTDFAEEYLVWFDNSYNLIRFEKIEDSTINYGVVILKVKP